MKKLLAVLTVLITLLSATPAFAGNQNNVQRFDGLERMQTSEGIAQQELSEYKTPANKVIYADGFANLMDVLLAAPLSTSLHAPIVLERTGVFQGDMGKPMGLFIGDGTYLNGTPPVSPNPTLIPGTDTSDPISTAAGVASQLQNVAGSFVVGYNALPDALSIGSYAAAHNYDILVANKDGSFPASEKPYLKSPTFVIGGPTLVADIPGATRIYGADRFATNEAVINTLKFSSDKDVVLANGTDDHLVDALVSAPLAAIADSPIVLVDTSGHDGSDILTSIKSQFNYNTHIYVAGGPTVIPQSIADSFNAAVPDMEIQESVSGQTSGSGKVGDPAIAPVGTPITIKGALPGWLSGNDLSVPSLTFFVKDGYKNIYQAGIWPTTPQPIPADEDTFGALVPMVAQNNDYTYNIPRDSDGYTTNNSGYASLSFVADKLAGPLTIQITPWDEQNVAPITVQLEWK